jgi:hypothetical protein
MTVMDASPAPAPVATVPPRSIWIARPWVDLLVGCGGWSLPLLAISYGLTGEAARQWSSAFYTLALISNYPHYMATVYRAYGRSDRGAHRLYTVWGTGALVALGALAHVELTLLPLLFTAYIVWSPWHYTGQNYGLLVMFLKRAGLEITPIERRCLRGAFVASYVMLLAAFNEGASSDPLVLSMALPREITRVVGGAALLVFVAAGVAGLVSVRKRAPRSALVAPGLLYVTQGLWFVVPIALAWTTGLAVPQTRYSSGILAVLHSTQYLWITQYFARREQGERWATSRYWIAVIAGGLALFLPIPWLASYVAHVDFTASMLIVTAVVNLHHFMIDGVVWKLRDTRVAKTLTAASPALPAPPAPPALPARPALGRSIAVGIAVIALAALAGLDQWRYWLASSESDPSALQAAIRLNPYDAGPQTRLLRILVDSGRDEEARTHLDQMIAAQPDDPNARVNAGVLARQMGRTEDAERHWNAALDLDRSLAHVHLYLAELLDNAGRVADALPHYREYLELVVQQQSVSRPDPSVVIGAVLRFGDALSRSAKPAEAKTQFELAAKMARQTGAKELEQIAQRRLAEQP